MKLKNVLLDGSYHLQGSWYSRYGKRALDVLCAIVALPVVAIVGCLVALLIHLDDGGPVFYKGLRRGRDGRVFTMLKFRSMVVNAPDIRNPDLSTVCRATDNRITRAGRFLRRTSIDELPQLINVLRGDMSLIGPRPNMTTKGISEFTSDERKRIMVRPGITGLNQAYYRNSVATDIKYRNDCYYVDHLSLRLDLRIFIQTFLSVIRQWNIHEQDHASPASALLEGTENHG